MTNRISAVAGVIAAFLALVSLWTSWPTWLRWLFGVVALVAAAAAWFTKEKPVTTPQSALIRGNVTNSVILRTHSNADVFVDGNVTESTLEQNMHSPSERTHR